MTNVSPGIHSVPLISHWIQITVSLKMWLLFYSAGMTCFRDPLCDVSNSFGLHTHCVFYCMLHILLNTVFLLLQ